MRRRGQGLQSGVGGAKQGSVFVEHDGDGNVGENRRELALISKSQAERALL